MDAFRNRSIPRAWRRGRIAALALLALGGCSVFEAPRDTRGARVDPELVKEITPGVQTRRDVLALLGTPSVTPAFDDLTWYYVGGVSRQRVARRDALIEQDVLAVHFSVEGTVDKVEQLSLADATTVTPVGRTTPSPGTEASVLQELFGNIGRFSPGGGPRRSGN